MISTAIALRYAQALFDTASKDERRILFDCFNDLLKLYETFPKFIDLLNSPEIKREDKESLLKRLFKEDSVFFNFLSLLLKKARFKYLSKIAGVYNDIFKEAYGPIRAKLTTAVAIGEPEKKSMEAKLDTMYGKKFQIVDEVDSRLLGGGVLIVSNQMIDFSLKEKLNKLTKRLLM